MPVYSNEKGEWHGAPYDSSGIGVFLNMELLRNAGFDRPGKPWQWEELLQMAKKLTSDSDGNGKLDQFGLESLPMGGDITWIDGFLRSFHARFVSPDKSQYVMNTEQAIRFVQFLADMRWVHHVIPQPGEDGSFAAGRSAMVFDGPWSIIWRRQNHKFEWDVTYVPGKRRSGVHAGSGFMVSSQTKHPEEAYLLWKELTGEEFLSEVMAKRGRGAPGRISAWRFLRQPGLPPANVNVFMEEMNWLEPRLSHPKYQQIIDAVGPALSDIWNNRKSAAQVLPALKPVIDQILREK